MTLILNVYLKGVGCQKELLISANTFLVQKLYMWTNPEKGVEGWLNLTLTLWCRFCTVEGCETGPIWFGLGPNQGQ